jgi:hypothetical protein
VPPRTYDLTEGHTNIEITLDGYYNEGLLIAHIQNTSTHGADGDLVGENNIQSLLNKTLESPIINGALSGTAIELSEDLVSDSDTMVPSVKAVKAYVDSQAGAVTLPATRLAFGNALDNIDSSPDLTWTDADKLLRTPNLVLTSHVLGPITAGNLEYDGTNLYFSLSNTERYPVLLDNITDGQNITVGTTTGTQIGTAPDQKIGFF